MSHGLVESDPLFATSFAASSSLHSSCISLCSSWTLLNWVTSIFTLEYECLVSWSLSSLMSRGLANYDVGRSNFICRFGFQLIQSLPNLIASSSYLCKCSPISPSPVVSQNCSVSCIFACSFSILHYSCSCSRSARDSSSLSWL